MREQLSKEEQELVKRFADKLADWAGYPLGYYNEDFYSKASELMPIIKEAGYVKLVKDRSLPDKLFIKFKANPELPMPLQKEITDTATMAYAQAQQDMLKQGWQKVQLR